MSPVSSLPPTRFLPRLLEQIDVILSMPPRRDIPDRGMSHADMHRIYTDLRSILLDSYTKRILFSARQAGIMTGIGVPPEGIQRTLRLPFEQFYLELDEDLDIVHPYDRDIISLRAMLLAEQHDYTLQGHEGHLLVNVAFFYRSERVSALIPAGMADAQWGMCLTCGQGYLPVDVVRAEPTTDLRIPDDVPPDGLIAAPQDAPDGALYYVAQGTALVSYLLAYLMAKSITIQAEPVSRQERRWLAARGRQPQPWHVVKVEPRLQKQLPPEGEPQSHHSFRYDVIGHLRFNRHRLVDGSYRQTVEWVPAHQRGLDHVDYIPKTYRVNGGKQIHPAMRSYWKVGQREAVHGQ